MAPTNKWFEVDKEGLAALIEEPARLVLELWQNAVDEAVTSVRMLIRPKSRGIVYVEVEDDSPEGFINLGESYRLYAKSKKRDDPTKRGRMNIGEKRFLALCKKADIASTTGRVCFHENGERSVHPSQKRAAGTIVTADLKLNKPDYEEALQLLDMILVPEGVKLTVNDEVIQPRPALREITATLNTVLPDEDGNLRRRTRRKTTVRLVEPVGAERPMIFEMGIPVVEHDGKYHLDVMQRVPLNEARDNVPPTFLRELREAVLNATYDLLQPEDSHAVWVADALPNASPEALQSFVKARYGDKVVVRDNAHPEATKRALADGYAVIEGRHLPKGVVSVLRDTGIVRAAGEHQEFRRDIVSDPNGENCVIPEEKWTPGMKRMAAYATQLGQELLGYRIGVGFVLLPIGQSNGCAAFFGTSHLTFNLRSLGHAWFDSPNLQQVDALLLHEFSHARAGDHWSDEFYEACCRLGAKLRTAKAKL
jgi:hypothetical protein